MAHARAFRRDGALAGGDLAAVDLGSGGGVPGVVLAKDLPSSRWLLLDSSVRRTAFLVEAVEHLGLGDRVEVVTGRAETVGRDPRHRGAYQVVVARAFGRPAVVAECGAPFLEQGGRLLVSEPPDERPDRWPAEGLGLLGLRSAGRSRDAPHLATLWQDHPCPPRYPRRVGIPAKRPLW